MQYVDVCPKTGNVQNPDFRLSNFFDIFIVYQDNYFSEVLYVLYKTVQASVKCPKIGLFGTKTAAWCLKKQLDLPGFRTFNYMRWVSFQMETRRHEMFKKYFMTAVHTKP